MSPRAPGGNPRRILVSGGSGFVGRRVVRRLLDDPASHQVLAVGGPDITTDGLVIDLLDAEQVNPVVAEFGPTDILHLAAASSVAGASQAPEIAWDVNLVGTRNLALAARRLGQPVHFIFASTAEVYGRAFLDGPCSEETPPQPVSTYARTKLAAEHLLEDFADDHLAVTTLRLFNHTGAGQDTRFVVPSFASQIAAVEAGGSPDAVIQVGNLDARRDFSDVDDIVGAYLAVIARGAPKRATKATCYNVGSGTIRTIRSILDMLVARARTPVSVSLDPARLRAAEITEARGVFTRFETDYAWRASTPFEETIESVLLDQRAARGVGRELPLSPA